MKLLIDSADLEQIKNIYEYYPVAGVTTNPSILSKNSNGEKDPYILLKRIRDFIGNGELHVQVISKKAEEMIEEAHKIVDILGKETYVKIPCIPEGLKAIKALKKENFNITATAIYTILQAFLAGEAGADYVAPYVNRIDNLGGEGAKIAREIHYIFMVNGLPTKVLGASFKNSQQVLDLAEVGVGAVTLSPDVFGKLLENPTVEKAVDDFISDFEKAFGKNTNMLN